jgi:ribosomal protein L22
MAEKKRKTEQAETEEKAQAAKEEASAAEASAQAEEAAAKDAEDAAEEAPAAEAEDAPEADAADDQPEADAADDVEDAPDADDEDAEEAPEAEAAGEGDAEPAAKSSRRRGSAETGAGTRSRKSAPKVDGEVVVRARARYVRSAPRKARLVMDHIRGRPVEQARAMLTHTPRGISTDILKLLDSAIANAESNFELGADELRVRRAFVDEGPTIKRYRPRALGRATRINKRTSHMTIELTSGERN